MMKKRRRTTGAILIAAMVCLVIVTATAGWMVRAALTRTRLVQNHHTLIQRQWLAAAASDRAAARAATEPDYAGEVWQLPEVLDPSAKVDIQITRNPDSQTAQLTMVIHYPPTSSGRTLQREIQVPQSDSE